MRIVIEVKRDDEPKIILNQLFKLTQMQDSFGMILLAIVGGQPREMGLIELLRHFIEHRVDVSGGGHNTTSARRRARTYPAGFKKALDHLDAIIA